MINSLNNFVFSLNERMGPFISQLTAAIINSNLQMPAFLHQVEYICEAVINMMNSGHSVCMQISRLLIPVLLHLVQ